MDKRQEEYHAMKRTSWTVRAVAFAIGLVIGGVIMFQIHPGKAVQCASVPKPSAEKRVLQSPLAGRWYEADPVRLKAEIQGFIDAATNAPMENVCALLLPHAGYRYSGPTAGYGVKAVQGKTFRRVVLMGPSHSVPLRNTAALPDVTHIATPLGEVPLDLECIAALKADPHFATMPEAHASEHSVQIEIPLLQCALGPFQLVPIVLGDVDGPGARAIGAAIQAWLGPDTLLIASSDFTHYGPNYGFAPFGPVDAEKIRALDMGAFQCIQNKDPEGFLKNLKETGATVCGHAPIAVMLAMLPKDSEAHLLHYDTSGRIMNDEANSVSYVAAAFSGKWPEGEHPAAPKEKTMILSDKDKADLLALARGTLTYYFEHGKAPESPQALGLTLSPEIKEPRGVFVTLQKNGQLRGCIGHIAPQMPLENAVIENAMSAAFRDPRFDRLVKEELPALRIEISVLTPLAPVASYQDIKIGQHGMVLSKKGRRAVFLPQVAPEQGWGLEETLSHLAQKAGLGPDDWREGAQYEVFEAIVFGEPKQ